MHDEFDDPFVELLDWAQEAVEALDYDDQLIALRELERWTQRAYTVAVGDAREHGASWERIGLLVHRTRQAAWERWG